jgi:hypothetical protein
VGDVALAAGEKIVQADDFMALAEKPLTEMGTQKASSAGDQNSHGENQSGPPRRIKTGSERDLIRWRWNAPGFRNGFGMDHSQRLPRRAVVCGRIVTNASSSSSGKDVSSKQGKLPAFLPAQRRSQRDATAKISWETNFRWSGVKLIGRAACGRATAAGLDFNSAEHRVIRGFGALLGRHVTLFVIVTD